MGFEVLAAVFWVVAPCSVVVRYRRFGGPCCLHLHREQEPSSPKERVIFALHKTEENTNVHLRT